ncbi:uncharacterized protein LOC134462585 [Engraulis encrasicolus]|uniref:uncharacterized protein LOC134462585 n=1 Tax=Engraulis encrasicolus TaxID=184585 RepID=UPI002FD12BEE
MDDLDHSVHIAERDWDSFYEESEECGLVQPLLAHEDFTLSDNEDPASSSCLEELPTPRGTEEACPDGNTVPTANYEEGLASVTSAVNQIDHQTEMVACCSVEEQPLSNSVPVGSGDSKGVEGEASAANQDDHNILTAGAEVSSTPEEESLTECSHPVVAGGLEVEVDDVTQQEDGPISFRATAQQGVDDEATAPALEEEAPPPAAEWKEKERWFVTLDDSPVKLRCQSGGALCQQKRRKKKTSRRSTLVSGWDPCLSPETERCTDRVAESEARQDVSKTSVKRRYASDSDLPYSIAPSTIFPYVLQYQAPNLKTSDYDQKTPHSDSSGQQPLCQGQEEETCKSMNTPNVAQPMLTAEHQSIVQSPQSISDSSPIQTSKLSSEKPSGLPKTSDNSDLAPTYNMSDIRPNDMPPGHSCRAGEITQEDQGNARLHPTHDLTEEQSTQRLATFHMNGGECLSPSVDDLETQDSCLAQAFGPIRPVFAISSFWDEMEKLTINDILHLRIVHDPSSSPESGHVDENDNISDTPDSTLPNPSDNCEQDTTVPLDSLDNADSDYFTHLDDSKPDRSSCEFSTFSDFDEDLLQMVNTSSSTSPEPQDQQREPAQLQGFSDSPYPQSEVQSEHNMELSRTRGSEPELTVLFSDSGTPLLVFSDAESTLSPSGSEYNMMSLDSEIVREMYYDSGLHDEGPRTLMLAFPYEETPPDSFILAGHNIARTPSPVLSSSSLLEDSFMISFNEMIEHCEDTPFDSLFEASNSDLSLQPYSENLSVAESFDYFFSDFDDKNIFFPLNFGQQESAPKTVPIFSCSQSLVRDLTFPEVEQFLDVEEEDHCAPIHVISRFTSQQKTVPAAPDVYIYRQGGWKNMLSLRRIWLTRSGNTSSWYQRARSWMSPGMLFRPMHRSCSTAHMVPGTCSSLQVFHLGDPVLRKQALNKIRLQEQSDASVFKKKYFLFSLRQSDMCLVCIAFASWVLKSTNLQSGDTWKAALLANVSAISAIQYLRHYKRKKGQDEP